MAQNKTAKIYANKEKQSSSANLTKFLPKKAGGSEGSKGNHSSTSNQGTGSDGEAEEVDENNPRPVIATEEQPPPGSSLVEQERKKKGLLGRKVLN